MGTAGRTVRPRDSQCVGPADNGTWPEPEAAGRNRRPRLTVALNDGVRFAGIVFHANIAAEIWV